MPDSVGNIFMMGLLWVSHHAPRFARALETLPWDELESALSQMLRPPEPEPDILCTCGHPESRHRPVPHRYPKSCTLCPCQGFVPVETAPSPQTLSEIGVTMSKNPNNPGQQQNPPQQGQQGGMTAYALGVADPAGAINWGALIQLLVTILSALQQQGHTAEANALQSCVNQYKAKAGQP